MTRQIVKLFGLFSIITLGFVPIVNACENFKSISTGELKEYRDKLKEIDADPLDRLFAFEELICSNKPSIRALAVREGLRSSRDDLVRNQVMFEALMQKSRIDIELSDSGNLTSKDKDFIRKYSGIFTRNVELRDREAGCISFNRRGCDFQKSLIVQGNTVDFNFLRIVGQFKLTGQNELVGFLRADDNGKYSRIPAVIKLF